MTENTELSIGNFFALAQTVNQLSARGFNLVSVRLSPKPTVRVDHNQPCRELDSALIGRGVHGNQRYVLYAAQVNNVQVEWRKADKRGG
jgi:hypothetical protein